MLITTTFTRDGLPADGLKPTVVAKRYSDGVVIAEGEMKSIGDGGYGFEFDEAGISDVVKFTCKANDDSVDSPFTTVDKEIKPPKKEKKHGSQTVNFHDSLSLGGKPATIAVEGYYPYIEGGKLQLKYKEYDELKKAYGGVNELTLYKSHEDHSVVGKVSDITFDDGQRRVRAKITPDLTSGTGLSAEFGALDVACERGTCQRGIVPTGVAVVEVPRNSKNVVDGMAESEKALKAQVDALTAEKAELEKAVNAAKEEKRKTILDGIVSRSDVKQAFKDGIKEKCAVYLQGARDALDAVVVAEKPVFGDGIAVAENEFAAKDERYKMKSVIE